MLARLLGNRLEDADPRVRQWTAKALGTIGKAAAPQAQALSPLLADCDEKVQQTAAVAMRKIKGLPEEKPKPKPRGTSKGKGRAGSKRSRAGSKGPKRGGSAPAKGKR